MSFSFDAMIIIPLSFTLLFGSSNFCIREAKAARDSAALIVQSAVREINPPHIYKLTDYGQKTLSLPVLQASAQKMTESISLAHDLLSMMKGKSSSE